MPQNLSARSTIRIGLVAMSLLLGSHAALSHDLSPAGRPTGDYRWSPMRVSFMPNETPGRTVRPEGLPPALEFVVVLPNRWAIGQDIRVCFYGGDDTLRQRILTAAGLWFQNANLNLVTGSPSGKT